MRIVVDQSGYDLLNIGDVAMLEACVGRLQAAWPDADIRVLTHDAARLAAACPGTTPARPGAAAAAGWSRRRHLRRLALGAEQLYKMVAPALPRRRAPSAVPAASIVGEVRAADLVVASGGGYLCDTWWWHGSGVLSVVRMAQRRGIPTAMFGQGIGPLTNRLVMRQARTTLPGLAVLGIRDGPAGAERAAALGASEAVVIVTGDDALELARRAPAPPASEPAIGLNLRTASYTGLDGDIGRLVGDAVMEASRRYSARVIGLPVSLYPADPDFAAIEAAVPDAQSGRGVRSTTALAMRVARCTIVVTASYHAAVFALARGVPAVCLTRSAYYDNKFGGLASLFGDACVVVPVAGRDAARRLGDAMDHAWRGRERMRSTAEAAVLRQIEAGHEAYSRLGEAVGAGNLVGGAAGRSAA